MTAPTPTTAPSLTNQKRYDLFDLILLTINDITTNEFMALAQRYPDLLKEYNDWLQTHNEVLTGDKSKLYHDFKYQLENYIKSEKAYMKDRKNCELQSKLHEYFFVIPKTRKELHDKEINDIWKKFSPDPSLFDIVAIKKNFVENTLPELSGEISKFIQSLNDAERVENKKLIDWFNTFESIDDPNKKIEAFEDIEDLLEEEFERETLAGKVNCRLTLQFKLREEIVTALLTAIMNAFIPEPKIKSL